MSKISIVTAFYDIGRGDWSTSVEKNGGPLPHYLKRTVDDYVSYFKRMCQLDTEIILYTSSDVANKLDVPSNVKIVEYDYYSIHKDLRKKIEKIHNDPDFIKKINPYQVRNPEYWSNDYVGVTSLKAFFVSDAFERGLINNDFAAWVDFGYFRNDENIPISKKWEYDFDPSLIHYFNFIDPDVSDKKTQISMAVQSNVVFIFGAVLVAQKEQWKKLSLMMKNSLENLMNSGLVDDDQGLLLMSYFSDPSLFKLHKIEQYPHEKVRFIIRNFNKHE